MQIEVTVCPFVDEETNRNDPIANGLNGLNRLAHLWYIHTPWHPYRGTLYTGIQDKKMVRPTNDDSASVLNVWSILYAKG
jgi:hypothetical protein